MIDTSQTIEISHSKPKLILLVALGVLMTAGAAWVLTLDFGPEESAKAWKVQAVSIIGVPFFLWCTLVAIQRLFAADRPVVTLTPAGFLDTRVAAKMVAWAAVEQISTWSHKGQKIIIIKVSPEVESQIELSRIAQWSRKANTALGADGLAITAQGLKTDYNSLNALCIAYATAARTAERPTINGDISS